MALGARRPDVRLLLPTEPRVRARFKAGWGWMGGG